MAKESLPFPPFPHQPTAAVPALRNPPPFATLLGRWSDFLKIHMKLSASV